MARKSLLTYLELPVKPGQVEATALLNWDVQPIEKERRTWGWTAFLSMWSTGAFCMSNFQIGSSMLSLGLNWWQVIVLTLVGHILAVSLILVSAWPGFEYGIPFPVATRAAWGHFATPFVVLNRVLLSVIWGGIQAWQGGLMTYVCLRAMFPSIDRIPNTLPAGTGTNLPQFVGFIVFFLIQIPMLFLSPKRLRYLVWAGAIAGFVVQLGLTIWAVATMGDAGFGAVLHDGKEGALSSSQLGWASMFCICLTISSITSLSMSICDYTRYSRSVKSGVWGQALSWIPIWLGNIFGILTVAATQRRFGAELWSVIQLLMAMQDASPTSGTRAAVFFCGLAFLAVQLGLNITGNIFSGGTDLASLLPRYISIRRGQFIVVAVSLAINPWYLVSAAAVFLSVISGYTIFIEPFLGILTANYFILFRHKLKIEDLYKYKDSIYFYGWGVNWRSVVAWVCSVAPHLPGFVSFVIPKLAITTGARQLYYIAPFTSFSIAFIVSLALGYFFPVASQEAFLRETTKAEAFRRKENFIAHLTTGRGLSEDMMDEKDPDATSVRY